MSDDLFGGRIRFVGGPKHNQFMACKWQSYISFMVPTAPKVVILPEGPIESLDSVYKRIDYELRKFVTAKRAIFFEYHLAEAKDDVSKDFAECPL